METPNLDEQIDFIDSAKRLHTENLDNAVICIVYNKKNTYLGQSVFGGSQDLSSALFNLCIEDPKFEAILRDALMNVELVQRGYISLESLK